MLDKAINFVRKISGKAPLCDVCHEREAVGGLRENCLTGPLKVTYMCEECHKKWLEKLKADGHII